MSTLKSLAFLTMLAIPVAAFAELHVPGATAYLDPDPNGAHVSGAGVTHWHGSAINVSWFGEVKSPGKVQCDVALRLRAGAVSKLRLTVAGQSRETTVLGKGSDPVKAAFGQFEIPSGGYQRFTLESLNAAGESNGDIEALLLDGPAAKDAHFNLHPRRNAASVHLFYPAPKDVKVEQFYCEVTAVEDPLWTYYMACGWHRGYFGMQVNGPTERRIIFSVWDSGGEAIDRRKVASEDRVTLVAKGDGVIANDFGHEGTGGHSHLVYPWKTGEKQRFLLTSVPSDETHTVYSGYYFHPKQRTWVLISSWKAPKDGGYARGLHSFSENFGGSNGHLRRKALFGNQWVRTADARWVELTHASFSHDPTGRADRLDRFMGVEQGQFFLSHGGFVSGFTRYGEAFDRPATGTPPADVPSAGLGSIAAAKLPEGGTTNKKAKILILTGNEYPGHKWKETAPLLAKFLAADSRLSVVVNDDPKFLASPKLHDYDAMVLNYMNWKSPDPGAEARANLKKFVEEGKGLVLVHFACGAFQDWPEFKDIVGRVWDPKLRGHDPKGKFTVQISDAEHPITHGLKSFETSDELYTCLTGKAEIRVIAKATSKVDKKDYPMAFVLQYGKGRVFHCVLGHDVAALTPPAVQELYRRGTAWAAGLPVQ